MIQWYHEHDSELKRNRDLIDFPQMEQWKEKLKLIDFERGILPKGEIIFHTKGCFECHSSSVAIGPPLTNFLKKFTPVEMLLNIQFPNRYQVPGYPGYEIGDENGAKKRGLILYQDLNWTLVKSSELETLRIPNYQRSQIRSIRNSLMPSGLLQDLNDEDLANLHAYLKYLNN